MSSNSVTDEEDNLPIDKREAEEILEESRSKDFWAVDFHYDNKDNLQSAIDVCYNSVPGNNYKVDYMVNQNGTRIFVRCVPCAKELLSFDPFSSHDKGKPHKKVRQQHLQPRNPNLQMKLKRQPLNLIKDIFERDSLEEMVDLSKKTILGIQFVYKEIFMDKEKFTCTLCRLIDDVTSIKKSEMFRHLTGKMHNRKYMELKFGYRKTDLPVFKEDARQIEEIEGRIHVPIVDFTKQMLTQIGPANLSKIKKERESPKRKRRKRHHRKGCRNQRSSINSSCNSSCTSRSPSPTKSYNWMMSPSLGTIKSEPTLKSEPTIKSEPAIKSEPTIKSEPVIPFPPAVPPPTPFPVMVDKSTNATALKADISQNILLLQRGDATRFLLEDTLMQILLHESLSYCNSMLEALFKERNIICYDDKGNIVTEAFRCAGNLVKHIDQLAPIKQ